MSSAWTIMNYGGNGTRKEPYIIEEKAQTTNQNENAQTKEELYMTHHTNPKE